MKNLFYLFFSLLLFISCNQIEDELKHQMENSFTKASYILYKSHLITKIKSTERLTQVYNSDWKKIRIDQILIDDIANALQRDYQFQIQKNSSSKTSHFRDKETKELIKKKRYFDKLNFRGRIPSNFITSYNQQVAIELVYLDSKIENENGIQLDSTNQVNNSKNPKFYTSRGNISGSRTISNYYKTIQGHFKFQLKGVKKYHIATLKRGTKEFSLGDEKYKVMHFNENSIFVLPLNQADVPDLKNIKRIGVTTDGYSTTGGSINPNLSWSILELFIKNNNITKDEFNDAIDNMSRSELKQKGLSISFKHSLDEIILYKPAEYYTSDEIIIKIKDVEIKE